MSVSVTVNILPVITINGHVSICEGSTINLSSSVGSTYEWSGPNAFSSALQNPTISNATTAQSGIYTLTVTNGSGCSAIATTSLNVNQNPTVTATNVQACENKAFFLTCDPSLHNIVAFSWTGPNGFSSILASPSKTNASLADAGTYSVTITSEAGCTASATTSVAVSIQPQAPSVISDNSVICKNGSATLTGTCSSSTDIFRWTTPPLITNSLASSSQRVVTQPGVYKGVCESSAGCFSAESTITITQASDCNGQNFLTVSPAKPFVCPNSSVTLSVSGCSGTVTWLGGPSTQTGTSMTVSPSITTTYFIQCSSGGGTTIDVLVASHNVIVSNNITTGTDKVKAVKR